jgi:uncharacterized protein (DUF2147 family)
MKKYLIATALSFALAGAHLSTATAGASPYGTWKRPDGSKTKVWKCGKNICAKIISGEKKGFNMFGSGLAPAGSNVWKGKMKHPKMTSATFNGTAKFSSGSLHVKGCMLGGMMCDSEKWSK